MLEWVAERRFSYFLLWSQSVQIHPHLRDKAMKKNANEQTQKCVFLHLSHFVFILSQKCRTLSYLGIDAQLQLTMQKSQYIVIFVCIHGLDSVTLQLFHKLCVVSKMSLSLHHKLYKHLVYVQ